MQALIVLLQFMGRHASLALPISVATGLLIAPLSNLLSHILIPALLIPLTLSLVRVEIEALFLSLKQWKPLLLICLWLLIVTPVFFYLAFTLIDSPVAIENASIIAAAAPPVTASAALALFFRFNAAICVVATVITMLLVPITLPALMAYLITVDFDLNLWALSLRLALFILAAFIIALLIKKWMGVERIHQQKFILDGISVFFISLFTIGIMRGAGDFFLEQPTYILQVFFISTIVITLLYSVTCLVFWKLGPSTAMAVALMAGNCNLGLMYLVLAEQASLDLLVYFAIGQIPMYSLPTILTPLIKRLNQQSP